MAAKKTGAKARKQATPGSTGADLPHPSSDEFAFLVAQHAWDAGLTANAIVDRLGLDHDAKSLMRVKRALARAREKFLRLEPLVQHRLKEQLEKRVNRKKARHPIEFHVVDDTHRSSVPRVPVAVHAAGVASRLVLEAARASDSSDASVVICNAGGRTVSEMVRALRRSPPLADSDEPTAVTDRLLFVSGNAAYRPTFFHQSANFLSVTMAELFGAGHLALPKVDVEDPSFPAEYRARVRDAALFICGAGSGESGLIGRYFKDHKWPIPTKAVGDLAFNLLDKDGVEVQLPDKARDFMNKVNPCLNLLMLKDVAMRGKVLLILDDDPPESKTTISVAALEGGYATDVVLGARLAKAILEAY